MAEVGVSLEDILGRRYGGIPNRDPNPFLQDEEEQLSYLENLRAQNAHEREQEALQPQAPGFFDRLATQAAPFVPQGQPEDVMTTVPTVGGVARKLGQALVSITPPGIDPVDIRVPPEAQKDVNEYLIGGGEAALQLGTGLIGSGVGALNFIQGTIRKFGQELPTAKYIESRVNSVGDPRDPNYWKKLKEQSQALSAEFTYQPRTQRGKEVAEAVSLPFQAIHYMSQGAAQSALARTFLTEDQRHALEYAHELITMAVIGEIGHGVLGRGRMRKFQEEFQKASSAPDTPPSPELMQSAEAVITAAEKSPAVMDKLELAKGINPTLLPELRAKGREILVKLNENPENTANITDAVSFYESTRRVNDDLVQGLRSNVEEIIPISKITEMPRADRVARLREMQRNQPQDNIDRWMFSKEEQDLGNQTFTTSQGSTYSVQPDGSTIRNKSYHPEHGFEDQGIQPQSKKTYYVTEEQATRLGEIQAQGLGTRTIEELPDGRIGMRYSEGPQAGKFERRTIVRPEIEPQVGLHPVEVFNDGRVHFGNKIISKSEAGGLPPSARGAEEPAPLSGSTVPELSSGGEGVLPPSDTPALRSTRRERDYNKMRRGFTEKERMAFEGLYPDKQISSTLDKVSSLKEEIRKTQESSTELEIKNAEVARIEDQIKQVRESMSRGEPRLKNEIGSEIDPEIQANLSKIQELMTQGPVIPTVEDIASGEAFKSGYAERIRERSIPTQDAQIENAQARSRMFTSEEVTLKRIQESLEKGIDISAELKAEIPGAINADIAEMRYKKLFELSRKGIKGSENRAVGEILQDIIELFAFDTDPNSLGSMMANVSLSNRQRMAAQRLLADAKKSGHDLVDYINEAFTNPTLMALYGHTVNDPSLRMIYRDYLNSVSDDIRPPSSVPKNMNLTGNIAGDPPIHRRVRSDGTDAPVVYKSEAEAVQNAPQSKAIGPSFLETPSRAFSRYGDEIKDLTSRPYHAIRTDINDEIGMMRQDLTKLQGMANYRERRNINEFAQSGRGVLTNDEQTVLNTLEVGIGANIDRVNELRSALGFDPIPDTADLINFARNIVAMKESGNSVNLVTTPAVDIMNMVNNTTRPEFPKTLTQRVLRISPEKDLFKTYDAFASQAIENVRLSPFLEKLKELTDHNIPDINATPAQQGMPFTPQSIANQGKWSMKEDNPSLYNAMHGWISYLEGKPNFTIGTHMGVNVDNLITTINNNLAFSLLSYSMSSVAAQPFALIQANHRVGPVNIATGLKDNIMSAIGLSKAREQAFAESHVLSARNASQAYGDWADSNAMNPVKNLITNLKKGDLSQAVTDIKLGPINDLMTDIRQGRTRDIVRGGAKIGMIPLEFFDMEAAVTTYLAGKAQGRKLGLSGKDLINFADDLVIETQGSGWRGDLAPIQRSAAGKAITAFQTFTISDWNAILNDVMKITKGASATEILKSVGKFAASVAVANTVADIFHINSPLPQPIDAMRRSYEKTKDPLSAAMAAGLEIVGNYAPIIGSSRYGKGLGGAAAAKAFVEFPQGIQGAPMAKSPYEPLSELAGVPGAGLYWRLKKKNDIRPVTDRIMNYRRSK